MQISGPVGVPPGAQGAKTVIIPAIPPASPGAHRYWRFYITANGGGATCSFVEIELRSVASGSDLTGSGTASASNSYTGWPPSQAVDNNTGTGWSAHPNNPNSSPQWWAYDFGSGVSHEIVEVQITPHSSFLSEAPTAFQFQYSDDGSAWTTSSVISGLTWPTATPQTLTITPTGVPAVYGVISSSSGQLLDVKAELPREYSEILLYVRILAMPPAQNRILLLADPLYGIQNGAGAFREARYATAYEGEPLTDFGDSLNNWLDVILLDFATPQMEFGESLDFWSDLADIVSGNEILVESDLNLWSDSNNLFNDLGFADSLVMADAVGYTIFEIMLPLFLSVADSMIKTTGPQPTRFEMKDGVSYFMDAAESPLFISIDDLETYLADATVIDFRVFFNTAEGEAFDSMQYNWLDEVAFDLIINASLSEDWMFQSDEIALLFEHSLSAGDSFSLSDAVSNAAITEFFEIFDSMNTMQDSAGIFLLVHLTVAVEDFFGLVDSGDSIVPLMGSANISYLRRYLNDAR